VTDFLDDYKEHVHKRLRSRRGRQLTASEDESTIAEVVFFPSFHAETILQANKARASELRLTTLSSSLWYSSEGSGPAPQRITEKIQLDDCVASDFWSRVEELQPLAISDSEAAGLDGMSVEAAYCSLDIAHSFSAWSPSEDSPQGRFVVLLYKLAWAVLRNSTSIERLEQLHGYLNLGIPYRVLEESPRRLRLFGRLSSQDEEGLRSLFSSISYEEPLVVDMENFEGMGTLLHPLFVEFASSRDNLAWVGPSQAPEYLGEVGIPESAISESIETARQKVLSS